MNSHTNTLTNLFIIDPLECLDYSTDTSLVIMYESFQRGHQVYYCTIKDIFLEGRKLTAQVQSVNFNKEKENLNFHSDPPQRISLDNIDILYMRKDPPVNEAYLQATLLLDHLPSSVLQINSSKSLRDYCEKLIPLEFPEFSPETVVTSSPKILDEFLERIGHIVIKPLNDCSGRGIFELISHDRNRNSLIEQITQNGTRYAVGQKYLPEIDHGEKRILLLGDKILGYTKRIPKKGDFRSNINAGGRYTPFELNKTDRHICAQVGKWLKHEKIHFAGIDIVGNYLIEVNITSPSCVREINTLTEEPLEKRIVDYAEKTLKQK